MEKAFSGEKGPNDCLAHKAQKCFSAYKEPNHLFQRDGDTSIVARGGKAFCLAHSGGNSMLSCALGAEAFSLAHEEQKSSLCLEDRVQKNAGGKRAKAFCLA